VRIVDIREKTGTLATTMRNAFIDFSQMTVSLVAVVTDVVRDGKPVVGYGFNANGRYAQGGILRERLIPRIMKADPKKLLDADGANIDPFKVFAAMMTNEKPGGHGDRAVAVAALDMAVWDAVAKIAGVPLWKLLAERFNGGKADGKVLVYPGGGYYYPDGNFQKLKDEMQSYLDDGYTVVKMKIGRPIWPPILRASRRSSRWWGKEAGWRSTPTQVRPRNRTGLWQGDDPLWAFLVRGSG